MLALPCDYLILSYLTLPYHTLSQLTFSCLTLLYLTLSYLRLPYLILHYLTLPYSYLTYLTLTYFKDFLCDLSLSFDWECNQNCCFKTPFNGQLKNCFVGVLLKVLTLPYHPYLMLPCFLADCLVKNNSRMTVWVSYSQTSHFISPLTLSPYKFAELWFGTKFKIIRDIWRMLPL